MSGPDRATDFESEGREFESLRARQQNQPLMKKPAPQKMPLESAWGTTQVNQKAHAGPPTASPCVIPVRGYPFSAGCEQRRACELATGPGSRNAGAKTGLRRSGLLP